MSSDHVDLEAACSAPFRTAAPPPPALAERLEWLERHTLRLLDDVAAIRHDTLWLTRHWHQAIDRVNEQLGQRARRMPHPMLIWAAGCMTGIGFGGMMLFGLARGWF